MGGKLNRYIKTGVPPRYLEYYAEHDPDTCPLCDEPNEGYINHAFALDDGTYINAIICQDCHFQIEEEEVFREDKYWEQTTPALRNYIQSGSFPPNAHRWTKTPFMCPFCRKDIEDDYWELRVPVGADMVGGTLYVCSSCADLIGRKEHSSTIYDNCRRCGEDYPITKDEHEARYHYDNLREHFCPKCAFKEHGEFDPQDRFQNTSCEVCDESVVVDLMLSSVSDLNIPRCHKHRKHIHDQDRTKYTVRIFRDKRHPTFRAVVTDKVSVIKITYELSDPEYGNWFSILEEENILPKTVAPADLVWRAMKGLKKVIHENNKEDTGASG